VKTLVDFGYLVYGYLVYALWLSCLCPLVILFMPFGYLVYALWLTCLCPLANLFMPFFEFIMGFIVVYTHSAFTSTKSKCTFGANTRDMKIYIINPHTSMYSQTCLKSLSIKDSLIFHECTVHII